MSVWSLKNWRSPSRRIGVLRPTVVGMRGHMVLRTTAMNGAIILSRSLREAKLVPSMGSGRKRKRLPLYSGVVALSLILLYNRHGKSYNTPF